MTCRLRFDRARVSSSDLIRQILAASDVRDFVIEDEPIEEIIKRIYSGEAEMSSWQPVEKDTSTGAPVKRRQEESIWPPHKHFHFPFASASPLAGLKIYREFIRIGFVNILAFRLRYYTGIITYLINVTVYFFIWRAVFANATGAIAGFSLPQILTYVSVGWILRSFYWNTIDQEMAYEVIDGKIAMDLIKPVSVQWMWLARAMGESAFRLILLTAPTAIIVTLLFPVLPPASKLNFALFLVAAIGSFFIMGALNFIIGTCAIPLTSILALIRAKFWLIELLSGLLIPLSFFPRPSKSFPRGFPSSTSPTRRCKSILAGFLSPKRFASSPSNISGWPPYFILGHLWWQRATRKITIHGG